MKLKSILEKRHLIMIGIGGSIGTGLFISSGIIINYAGPILTLFTYFIIAVMVYFIMSGLSELTAYFPVTGSFYIYASKYVDEAFGFALGWNYWCNWVITIAVDLVAAQIIMGYWFPNVDKWIWSITFLVLIFLINYISIKGFSEIEYLFSFIKIITVIIFIIFGLLVIFGLLGNQNNIFLYNFDIKNLTFIDSFIKIITISMNVAFCFQGIELIGMTVTESKHKLNNISKIIKCIFWIILILYIFTILVIGLLTPYISSNINFINNNNIISPFTLVFKNIGLIFAATTVNFIILISVLSSGNLGVYAASRMLYALSLKNKAPKVFSYITVSGVPIYALITTILVSGLCFLSYILNEHIIYQWLLNISSMAGFIVWFGIIISHYRFRKGYVLRGYDIRNLSYCAIFFPFSSIFSIITSIIVVIGSSYFLLLKNDIVNIYTVFKTYISFFMFFIIWLIYKIIKKTHIVKYHEMDF